MTNKKKASIAASLLLALLCIAALTWWLWPSPPAPLENYVPGKELAPAYYALTTESHADSYDIEETVRIMNALEAAQTQSEDFTAFLEYMARQDYSRVAPDVIEQKKQLFPILQRLFDLKKAYADLDDDWVLMRSAGTGISSFANQVNPLGILGSVVTGDATLASVSVVGSIDKAQTAAFEEYERQKKLKGKLADEIESIRLMYVRYLEGYAPVYFKYMKEWDALCLRKDKAYLDLYAGRSVDAYNHCENILKEYPTNRETLLLKSLALINIANRFVAENGGPLFRYAPPADSTDADSTVPDSMLDAAYERQMKALRHDMNMTKQEAAVPNDLYKQAAATLDYYLQLYPSRSAPALVLKGLLYRSTGHNAQALSCFDQASIEYPRQAADLTDLMDAYRNRSYLNRTSEGKYLLRLYRSTMEGFGIFSPNLLKANYYAAIGDTEQSRAEIFNHFFRRGNQDVYHCLLSDMQFCEENMYSSFKQILIEQSFLDVSVEPATDWKLQDRDDAIKVTINNRSDIDLENVRIFLCLHYTDMYKDEYDVLKLPTVNVIRHGKVTQVGEAKLDYEDKKYEDITRIRAIAMTDDKICWIDNVDYKYKRAADSALKARKARPNSVKEQLLEDFDVTKESLLSTVRTGISVTARVAEEGFWSGIASGVSNMVSGQDNKLHIELPRILSILDPVFSLYPLSDKDRSLRPSENYLSAGTIRLSFDYKPKKNDTIPLYIYSDLLNLKVTILFVDGKARIADVEKF